MKNFNLGDKICKIMEGVEGEVPFYSSTDLEQALSLVCDDIKMTGIDNDLLYLIDFIERLQMITPTLSTNTVSQLTDALVQSRSMTKPIYHDDSLYADEFYDDVVVESKKPKKSIFKESNKKSKKLKLR